MTFSHWCQFVLTSSPLEPRLAAQMHNLVTEDRIEEMSGVYDQIGAAFGAASLPDVASAEAAIQSAQVPLWSPSCSLLGLIPCSQKGHHDFRAVSFVTGTQIERHILPTFSGRATAMPPRVPLPPVLFARRPRRFLWTTFEEQVQGLSPTEIAISLGLSHFLAGETVYRIPLGNWPQEVYVPTCIDSGIFEAWMRPPLGHSLDWGLTRNLRTGASDKPELLVQVVDVEGRGLVAERVGSGADVIDLFTPDYLLGRDLSVCDIQ